ncbi:MAG: filamentous hemagglutinin N-terminal domain-containing protein, partial [Rhodoferax sp.]|nr:filamentous hemagglutinin N-terminal domain-containing protein [Rhodoferax sp.]
MNKSYRLIWNELVQAWVVVSELTKSRGKRASALALATASSIVLAAPPNPPSAGQLPTGGQVVAGQASILQSGAAMQIHQTTNRAAIDWQTFNLGSQARVHFQQPSASSATLNRVLDPNPSQLFGRLTANGQVFLSNSSGIYFGRSASVDVGGLVATTHRIGVDDFMAGRSFFTRDGAGGSIVNEGELQAQLGGYIALLAPEVRNQGVVIARMGAVALAAGESFELEFNDATHLAGVRVSPGRFKALVDNAHAIEAPDGLVILSARAVEELQGGVVRHSGSVEASSLSARGGRIVLESDSVELGSGSRLAARGATGGGEVLVGGNWQGQGSLHQATRVHMAQGASIDTSATQTGDGGTVVLWSDVSKAQSSTSIHGIVIAQGGDADGNGGRVETSGAVLSVGEGTRVDTRAPRGAPGLWLLDPTDFSISAGAAAQTTSGIGASTLSTNLNSSSVTIQTDSAGAGTGNITVGSAVTKTSGAATTLTLAADRNILVNADISGSVGSPLNVVLASRARGGAAGTVNVAASVRSFGGNITIGGADSLASGYAIADGSVISANSAGVYVGVTRSAVVDATGDGSGAANATMPTAATGGNIVIRGSGSAGAAQSNMGIYVSQEGTGTGSIVTGGSGNIDLDGIGGNGNTFWSIGSAGILLGLDAYIKANQGNLTLKGTAGTGSDRYGIAATSNKVIGTQAGYVNIEGSSLLIRDGTLTLNAGADSDIKAPIVGCTGGAAPSGCAAFGLTKTGTGILNLAGNAEAWNVTPPTGTRNTPTNGTFTDLSVNVVSPVVADGALYAFVVRPATINLVGGSTATPSRTSLTVSLLNSKDKLYGNANPTLVSGTDYSVTGCTGCVSLDWGSALTLATAAGNYSYGSGATLGTANLFSLGYVTGSASAYNVTWNYGSGLSLRVDPRSLGLTASKTYNGSTRFDGGFVLSGIVNGDATPAVSGTADVASANAASYTSFASSTLALNNANYTLSGGSVAASINKAALTVTASNASKTYNGLGYSGGNGVSYSGFVNSETSAVLGGTLSYGGASQGARNVGSYAITAAGLTSGNYSLSFTDGSLTVNPAALTITAASHSKTYDGTL